jgi:hypothetical protein
MSFSAGVAAAVLKLAEVEELKKAIIQDGKLDAETSPIPSLEVPELVDTTRDETPVKPERLLASLTWPETESVIVYSC